jgi:hypothetical protein
MNATCRFAKVSLAAALLAAVGLVSPAAQAADDATIGGALMGLVGVNTNSSGEKIDYRERAKVVVPPNRQALPAPRQEASRPASWPVDQENARRSGARAANSAKPTDGEPARENLTEPPPGYRRATKSLAGVKDPDVKSTGWFDSVKQAVGLGGQ